MSQLIACEGCGSVQEAHCECGKPYLPMRPLERAKAAIAREPEKANRVIADEIGVSRETVSRARGERIGTNVPKDDKPKGYDPAIQTGRVQEFVGLWKQMDPDEQDHVIRLIVGYKQGKRIT